MKVTYSIERFRLGFLGWIYASEDGRQEDATAVMGFSVDNMTLAEAERHARKFVVQVESWLFGAAHVTDAAIERIRAEIRAKRT